jgi:hypothetical protein
VVRLCGGLGLGEEDREVVTVQSREQALATDDPPQPFRDGDQQEVAAIAAEPVVDVVEGRPD